ncbi:UvrD-helicase domain-containing protein [Alkalihalobacillus pseudalcaliphilus]|uniref:UvrD-helicase domain-containing protein n=1 Tax=Alkalihalobacillus pseudalcaliphilus TaxID=79884 RepID=UPI00064D7639|nr:ATP-dependent helicase [Alkalihalobacillus pseudalcaliphilus]KMK76744.1 hypothetical protein AB990_07455 [Alkalihalobacillus pseudalcaliphilus]
MDLSKAVKLEDSKELIPIEEHFKLYAGPGAGKTTFLTNHIKNVLGASDKLKHKRKIACITYTNAAVDNLRTRLDTSLESVEITTIHSFCYKHIVKPFLWLLDHCPVAIEKMEGHDEIKLRRSQIDKIKKEAKQSYLSNSSLMDALNKLQWLFKSNGKFELGYKRPFDGMVDGSYVAKIMYMKFKEAHWSEGRLSHDDVLYFAYRIILEHPQVREIIRGKFPYIFIDEFQDTSPLQVKIVKIISDKETVIGVIGDICQSIYSFQGASVGDFEEFEVKNMKLYILQENHRSSKEIVNILNHMRKDKDFQQETKIKLNNSRPTILIGDKSSSYEHIKKKSLIDLMILAYRNKTLDNLQKPDSINQDKEVNYLTDDSDSNRAWRIYHVIKALEYAKTQKIKEALKAMKMAYRKEDLSETEVFRNLKRLINIRDKIYNLTLTDFYNDHLFGHYNVKAKISRGVIKQIYDSALYSDAAVNINVVDEHNNFRSIHNAKGEEFENVFLIIPSVEKNELSFLLEPDMDKETHRVYYVALSRAIKGLFISVPSLTLDQKSQLEDLEFSIIET